MISSDFVCLFSHQFTTHFLSIYFQTFTFYSFIFNSPYLFWNVTLNSTKVILAKLQSQSLYIYIYGNYIIIIIIVIIIIVKACNLLISLRFYKIQFHLL